MASTAATKAAPSPSPMAAASAAKPSRSVSSVRSAEAMNGVRNRVARTFAPAELFFALIVHLSPTTLPNTPHADGRSAYFFSQAAKASAKARSPGGPFSIARMARPPYV